MKSIIEVNNVSMRFKMTKERIFSLKEYFIKFVKGELVFEEFRALTDVSFSVKKGEILGIIGYNGAGKSTMLKVISGIMNPTSGYIKVEGVISPLIELGSGFDMELTARENIFLNGYILGYSKKFIKEHFDKIVEFSELEEFLDVPVKNFSSGMIARLGFAIATIVQPEILIVDEILSVGDFKFQEKSENKIKEMLASGTTVILVSHAINQIEDICTKVLWLEHGRVRGYGNTKEICEEYKNS
jgi:ABC-2 type transport system ATP-binding protein